MKGLLILDLIIVVVVLAMIGITSMIGMIILDDFDTGMKGVESSYNSTHVQNARQAIAVADQGSVLIFVVLIAGAIISSYALREHPVFAIFTIIVLFVSAFIVAGLSNFYQDFANDPSIVAISSEFPLLNQLFQNIVAIIFIVG
jgi:uncharacterized membrane protein YjfL (UPF0719 family)